jgi:hypothetical protein
VERPVWWRKWKKLGKRRNTTEATTRSEEQNVPKTILSLLAPLKESRIDLILIMSSVYTEGCFGDLDIGVEKPQLIRG